jgi:hypothetical protein
MAQTATRMSSDKGPKMPKTDSRAFLAGTRLARVFQMDQKFL